MFGLLRVLRSVSPGAVFRRAGPLFSSRSPFWAPTALLLVAGCVAAPRYAVGVELAPDADGWRGDLAEAADTIRYHWAEEGVRVDVEEWPNDPLYFMVSVRNEADRAAQMLVQGVTPGPIAHGSWDLFADHHLVTSGRLAPDGWITVPARCTLRFYIDGLPWRNAPSRGDRIDASVDVIRERDLTTCPLSFHVARVFRRDR